MTELRLRLTSDPAQLAPVRRSIRSWAAENGIQDGDRVARLLLACGEALANAIEHAYPSGQRMGIDLLMRLDARGRVVAQVRDAGQWRRELPEQGSFTRRGRGLALMRRAMGRVEVVAGRYGTVVTLTEQEC